VYRQGFSLIELSISLGLVALMVGFGLQMSGQVQQGECTRSTADDMAQIQNAIDRFVTTQGRYPLPASRHLGASDPAHGREAASPFDGSINRVPQASPVLIGALPHVTLNLPTELSSDCWGHQFTYAVTQNFTTTAGYSNVSNYGGIILRYGTLASAQELDGQAAYAVISHGMQALGASATNYQGPEITCNSVALDPAQPRIDKENCDTLNAIFYLSEINTDEPTRYFDDFVVVANRITSPNDCGAAPVTWGTHCAGNVGLTLGGLSVNVTNITAGYTGLAVSTCSAGVRTTLGVCLPIGACVVTSPRSGNPVAMLTNTTIHFGTGVCKTYKCCSGGVGITPLSPCLTPLDLPGLGLCP
jgi:prepilin-type N-terminal cleavage/methylation domain-containing protein